MAVAIETWRSGLAEALDVKHAWYVVVLQDNFFMRENPLVILENQAVFGVAEKRMSLMGLYREDMGDPGGAQSHYTAAWFFQKLNVAD